MMLPRLTGLLLASVSALGLPVSLAAQQPDTLREPQRRELPVVTVEVSRLSVGGMPLARTPFSAQVITAEEVERGRNLTVADLLLRLPGVSAADVMGGPFQPDISMRGFGISPVMGLPQGLSVFVDGVRVNEPDGSQVNFNLIPLHAIERVEVLRGPSGPFGKNALGGAIHIVTRRGGAGHRGEAEFLGGSFAQAEGRAAVSGAGAGFDYHLSTRYLRSDGWRDAAFTHLRHLFGRVGWRGERTDLWLSYTLASDSILQAGSLPSSWLEDPATIPARFRSGGDPRTVNFTAGDFFGPRLHFVAAGLTRQLAPALSLQANAFVRGNRSTQFNANFTEPDIRIASAIRSVGGAAQLAFRSGPLQLLGGTEYTLNDVDLRIFQHPNEFRPDFPRTGLQTEDVGTREHNVGLYTQARLDATPRLGLTATLRYDHVDLPYRDRLDPENSGDNLFRQLTGGAGFDYLASPGVVLFASYGRGFRAPVIMELACADPDDPCPLPYELGADPPLEPVTTDTWQGGVRLFRGAAFAAELSAYRAEVHDDIFFVQPPETRAGFFQNLERTRRQGVELSLRGRPVRMIELHGDVALTRATFQTIATLWAPYLDDDDDHFDIDDDDLVPPTVQPGSRFPMVPGLRANLGATFDARGWRTGFRLSHTGSQWLRGDEDNQEPDDRLEPYTLLHAHLERDIRRATLFLNVENLLDTDHATFGVLALNRLNDPRHPHVEPFVTPGQPRRVYAGLRLRLW